MSVRPETLETPESTLELVTREAEVKPSRKLGESPEGAELKGLRGRVAVAKAITPKDPIPHCGDCYRRGWDAALRAIDG